MYKLLSVGMFKLSKSKVFFSIIIITLLIAIIMVGFAKKENNILIENLETVLVGNINIIAFFIVIFVTLFTGTEYSGGAIRNKIVVRKVQNKNIFIEFND